MPSSTTDPEEWAEYDGEEGPEKPPFVIDPDNIDDAIEFFARQGAVDV